MHTPTDLEAVHRNVTSWLSGKPVDWMLVCGSGMGRGLVGEDEGSLGLQILATIGLADLGLPVPNVAGHGQSLVYGKIGPSHVCVQTGRLHPYEGIPIQVCTAALEGVIAAGARGVALTCAVGALNPDYHAGQLVALCDQMALFGPTPLRGPTFIDCSEIYSRRLRARIHAIASTIPALGGPLDEAVYAHARGPQYESPAETKALRMLGGDIVGMSTTYEAIAVTAHQLPLCAVGVVTNAASQEGLSHIEVQQRSEAARGTLAQLLAQFFASDPAGT